MGWGKLDDKFHSHIKVAATSSAALGLWAVMLSWCAAHETDGFIPLAALKALARFKIKLAEELVQVGLWERADGSEPGYRFHDYSDYNPSKADLDANREEWRTKKKNQRRKVSPGDSHRDSLGESGLGVGMGLILRSSTELEKSTDPKEQGACQARGKAKQLTLADQADPPSSLPPWLPAERWQAWKDYRAGMHHKWPWKPEAERLSMRTLAKLHEEGQNPAAVIDQAIERGYRGLFPVGTTEPRRPRHVGYHEPSATEITTYHGEDE